jgi:hypothetical protein
MFLFFLSVFLFNYISPLVSSFLFLSSLSLRVFFIRVSLSTTLYLLVCFFLPFSVALHFCTPFPLFLCSSLSLFLCLSLYLLLSKFIACLFLRLSVIVYLCISLRLSYHFLYLCLCLFICLFLSSSSFYVSPSHFLSLLSLSETTYHLLFS